MSKDKKAPLQIDFSKFSDADLEAYENGDMSVLSDNALEAIAKYEDEFQKIANSVSNAQTSTPGYGIATTAAGTVGALTTGLAPRATQKLVDAALPEDLRGGYKAPAPAAPVVAKPTVAPAPGADYFSPFGAGEGAVKNATHNVDEVLKNKVAQAAIQTPGYVAPGNSLILQPSSSLPTPKAPTAAAPLAPPPAKPKVGVPQMRAALQSSDVMPAHRLPSSIKGGLAGGFGANAVEEAQRGNYGSAATSALGSGSSIAAMASNPKLARAGKLGMAATILGKGYQALQGRNQPEEKAIGGLVGYKKGKKVVEAVESGLDAVKKLAGYLEHTPQKQNPVVGKRFEKETVGNLMPKVELDLEKHRGSMIVPKPWDSTSRGERIKSISGVKIEKPFDTEGGRNWMLDKQHYDNDISGASNFGIASRIHDRVGEASRAGEKLGLSGQVLEMPITMGYYGPDFSHHPTELIVRLMNQKEFKPDVLEQFSNQVRAYNEPGKGQIYKNFVGYGDPRFEEQMYKGGFGLETTPGNLRKTMAHRGMLKENQKLIGFNEEDLRNAITDETLLGVPKGFGGGMFSEGRPYGALTPSQSRIYDTNNPGRYIGSSQEAPIEIWMPDAFGTIKDELSAKYPKKTGNSLRQDVIGALEKRKSGFYQPINDRVINNVGYYKEGLKEGRYGPNDIEEAIRYVYSKKEGGEVQGYSAGKKVIDATRKLILPPAENAARTQIIGTLPTYEKAGSILQQRGATGRGIDFGAGLGQGAKALGKDFDTYEPFAKNWTPTYSNAADVPSDAYGQLTNLNVLNVVPREVRDEIVKDIGRVMEPGGLGIITTRGKDVMNAKGLAGPEPMSVITSRDTYQKGFNKDELEEYLKYMLGDKFDINRLNLGPAGALIKKK